MLKWTKRAEPAGCATGASAAATTTANLSALMLAPSSQRTHTRRSLGNLSRPQQRCRTQHRQRKSLGSSELCKRMQRDKENHNIPVTPHPYGAHRQNVSSTPVIAFGSKPDTALRDVQNITPKQQHSNSSSLAALLNAMTPSRKRPLPKSPPSSPLPDRVICSSPKETAHTVRSMAKHTPYASTLPTFDVEYSPCGAAPQPLLAAANKAAVSTITDSIFNQPRYFQEPPVPVTKRLRFSPNGMTPLSSRLSELRFSKLTFKGTANGTTNVAKKARTVKVDDDVTADELSNMLLNNNCDKNRNQNVSSRAKCSGNSSDNSLGSSALDDTALDKMIDAILESARKDRPSVVRSLAPRKIQMALMQVSGGGGAGSGSNGSESPTYTAAEDPASDLNKFCDNFHISPAQLVAERTIILDEPNVINEREVRTPEPLDKRADVQPPTTDAFNRSRTGCLRRQRAVRRKTNAQKPAKKETPPTKVVTEPAAEVEVADIQMSDVQMTDVRMTDIQMTDITTIEALHQSPEPEELTDAERLTREAIHITSPKTPEDTEFVLSAFFKKTNDELANMNTPIIAEADANATYSQQPHCGIASIASKMSTDSTPFIHTNDLQASSTPTHTETVKSIRRCLTFSDSPSTAASSTAGSDDSSLEKRKSTASSTNSTAASVSSLSTSVRAVSGALDLHICNENNKILIHVIRCRDLARSSGGPVNAYVKVAILPETQNNESTGFQRTAVHRNSHRPFFDHRFIFDVNGQNDTGRIQLAVWHRDRECKRSDFLGCISMPVKSVLAAREVNGTFRLQPKTHLTIQTSSLAMYDSSQTSVDEVIGQPDDTSMALTQKKLTHLHDEHLFLRFLELDQTAEHPEVTGRPYGQHAAGRTPYTMTKTLTRTSDTGFGFSVVWTHPPRIERIEPGLSADVNGIVPGDYVIFVDRHNVVSMPEVDTLSLIKAQGSTLTLEIYRRPTSDPMTLVLQPNQPLAHFPSVNNNNNNNNNHEENENAAELASPKQTSLPVGSMASTCSNVSLALDARKMHLPQVTFSKEVGRGVIV